MPPPVSSDELRGIRGVGHPHLLLQHLSHCRAPSSHGSGDGEGGRRLPGSQIRISIGKLNRQCFQVFSVQSIYPGGYPGSMKEGE
jgi:hypothetical protein